MLPAPARCPQCDRTPIEALHTCARCGSAGCLSCVERACCAACAAEVLREVLRGRRVRARPGSAKITRVLLDRDGDVLATPMILLRQRPGAPRCDCYSAALAPYAIGELLDRAGLRGLDGPTVAFIPAGEIRLSRRGGAVGYPDLCAWFRVDGPNLEVRTRAGRPGPATAQPIAAEGDLAWPAPVPSWSQLERHFRDFDPPLACPHCGAASARLRDLAPERAVVCPACGRSFTV